MYIEFESPLWFSDERYKFRHCFKQTLSIENTKYIWIAIFYKHVDMDNWPYNRDRIHCVPKEWNKCLQAACYLDFLYDCFELGIYILKQFGQ